MAERRNFSRRAIAKLLGATTGLALTTPQVAFAGLVPTPSQVEGPFHPVDKQPDTDLDLTRIAGHTNTARGEVILVRGRVLDTSGHPLGNALVDVWQANHHGRYSHPRDGNTAPLDPDFQGWGLVKTDRDGWYGIRTVKPGAYPLAAIGGDGWRCRHIHFKVSRDGHRALTTQMYFRGDPLLVMDAEFAKVSPEHRQLLVASAGEDAGSGLPVYRFDLVLAGA